MKSVTRTVGIICISFGMTLLGCDSSHTISSPAKNYFLKYYGHEGQQTGVDFVVNTDGSIVLLGTSQSPGQANPVAYLVKVDPLGNVVWEKTLGGPQGTVAKDIELTTTGLVVVGNSLTSPGNRDIFIETLDANGQKQDSLIYGLSTVLGANGDEDVNTVTQTLDGGFIVTGSSSNVDNGQGSGGSGNVDLRDAIHVRFTSSPLAVSPSVWRPAHGGGATNVGTKVFQLNPYRFLFFGYSDIGRPGDLIPNFNYWILNLNSDGEIDTLVAQPGTPGNDRLGSVTQLSSPTQNIFYLSGITTTSQNTADLFVTRVDVNMTATDTSVYYFNGRDQSFGFDLKTPDSYMTSAAASASGGYYLLTNEATTGNTNMYLTKLTSQNGLAWNSPVIYGGAGDDLVGTVRELADGKLLIIGTMAIGADQSTKMVLMKVNKGGQFSD